MHKKFLKYAKKNIFEEKSFEIKELGRNAAGFHFS